MFSSTEEVSKYNRMRRCRAKSAMSLPQQQQQQTRIVYENWNKYNEATIKSGEEKENNYLSILKSKQLTNERPSSSGFGFNSNIVDSYRSADGTIYTLYQPKFDANTSTLSIDYPSRNVIHIPRRYHEQYRQWAQYDELPVNLRHKFGSRRTRELLDDQIKVHDTLSDIYNAGINRKHVANEETNYRKSDKETDEPNATYYDLSNHLRYAVSRGYPTATRTSHLNEVHNDNLSKKFFADKDNFESPYRRKKDWLLKWTEANILRERVFKSLGAVEAEKAKINNAINNAV